MRIEGTTSATEAGTYDFQIILLDPASVVWKNDRHAIENDEYSLPLDVIWEIGREIRNIQCRSA